MGICWYCHWGWAEPVAAIYEKYARLLGSESPLDYGPGHVVWGDENFEDGHVRWCIGECGKPAYGLSPEEDALVRRSLEELLAVPEAVRCCEPAGYDDEHPERYPPPPGVAVRAPDPFPGGGR